MAEKVGQVAKVEEIGLVLVHGMGEQARLEHLRSTARELATYVGQAGELLRLSIVDRSDKVKPGKGTEAPIVIHAVYSEENGQRQVRLHLHEVWWADLGISGGFIEHAAFWIWGLGQWAAEWVRKGRTLSNTSQLMAMPRFSDQAKDDDPPGFLRAFVSRFMLAGAALLALLTFFTWSAAKKLVSLLSDRLPEPSLIFLFLGDVKIYERPGAPGKGTLLDPDMPMRATIRRRMVSTMVEVAARGYDRWYVLAHSLGTVLAWNGIQETEIALPNYLPEETWRKLPDSLKTKSPFKPEGAEFDLDQMMPIRPPWLADDDGISRPGLFARFGGLVTYGSPLDKFAALWPRIVCLNLQAAVFPEGAEWLNLYDRTDPVAAHLDAFRPPEKAVRDPDAPNGIELEPVSFSCRSSKIFLLSHIRYLVPRRAWEKAIGAGIVRAIVTNTSLLEAVRPASLGTLASALRAAGAVAQVLSLLALMTIAAGALLIGLGKLLPDWVVASLKPVLRRLCEPLLRMLEGPLLQALPAGMLIILLAAVGVIILSGMLRMGSDAFRRHH